MFMVSSNQNQSGTAAAVQLPAVDTSNSGNFPGFVYAGLRFDSDGYIYRMDAAGNWQQDSAWLLSGAAADYWLHRTITTGTLDNDDGDALQLNTDDLDYWIRESAEWAFRSTVVEFKISSDSAGSSVIATRSYNFAVEVIGTGSPP